MKVRDECGVIAVQAPDAGEMAILGLHALQHRGQESAGVATFDGSLHLHKAMGLVAEVFAGVPHLPGPWSVGHARYSTSGASCYVNAGPFAVDTPLGPLALAHNGNIVNAGDVRTVLLREHAIEPESASDSELLALLLKVAPGDTWTSRLQWMGMRARGAYSLTLLTSDRIIGVRDPLGIRPLSLGRLRNGWALASESCAFTLLGGQTARDLRPGEILEIGAGGRMASSSLTPGLGIHREAFCVFEHVYLARPDTIFGGRSVHAARRAMGEELAREAPAEADLVIGVPDSGTSAALGYSTASGIPFGEGLIKNRYIGRTFIQPEQIERERLIRLKFGTLPLAGKRLVLVDDSIVRGNTMRPIVALLREAGAAEVHVRVACPPLTDPCFFGVDMPSSDDLVANRLDEAALQARVGADSLRYLTIRGLLSAIRGTADNHCLGCLTGRYPMALEVAGGVSTLRSHPLVTTSNSDGHSMPAKVLGT